MSKFFKVLSNGILILTIIVLSLYFVLRIANVIRIYSVETGSMEDKIHAGDYILLFRKKDYYVGDVVTYKLKNYFITHRIVRIENEKVEGKVIYWGGILNFVINYKFAIIAFLIGMYLLSCYFEDNKEKVNKKSKKKEQTIDIETNKEEKIMISDITMDDVKEEIKEKIIDDEKEIILDEKPKRQQKKKEKVMDEKPKETKKEVKETKRKTRSTTKKETKSTKSTAKKAQTKGSKLEKESTKSKSSTTKSKSSKLESTATKSKSVKASDNKKTTSSTTKGKKSSKTKTK